MPPSASAADKDLAGTPLSGGHLFGGQLSGGQTDSDEFAQWNDDTRPESELLRALPFGAEKAWLETKYNKEKTLGYRVMRWRDPFEVNTNGNPIKRMAYLRRLGGIYKRRPPRAKVNRYDDEQRLTTNRKRGGNPDRRKGGNGEFASTQTK